jgi:apolipoprotein D and lipocalin family protein
MRGSVRSIATLLLALSLMACTGLPNRVEPVSDFDLQRYLGTWYEIARLDHSFERGLSRVTAEYSLREDGGIKVINRGWSDADQKWSEAEGRAYFVDSPDVGHLKVSFFGPFYSSYAIFGLDHQDYQYAWVSGYKTDYLWLLSRQPQVSDALLEAFRLRASQLGFDTDGLIYVSHEPVPAGR